MNVAFLSVGGNLGQRLHTIRRAIKALENGSTEVIRASRIYETEAWGSNSANKFLNQVLQVRTALTASELLHHLLRIEQELGRTRTAERNSDRSVDLDILFFNAEVLHSGELEVPHPRLQLRRFVLVPLCEIAPGLLHPVLGKRMDELLAACSDALHVAPYLPQPYICLEGNIGVGKTTLSAALAGRLGAAHIAERFHDMHFLPLFYEDPGTYAFPLEYSFFLDRWQQLHQHAHNEKQAVVSDYSIYKSFCFAKVNLPPADYRLFEQKGLALVAKLRRPDAIVFLETDLQHLSNNIRQRGRSFEVGIGESYLQKVGDAYKSTLEQLAQSPIYSVRINSYDASATGRVLDQIETICRKIV